MENCQRFATNIFPNTKCENVGHFRVKNPKGWSLKHETLHVETLGPNMLIDSNWFCLMPKSYTNRSAPTSLGRPYFLPAIGALFIEDECVELPNKSVLSIIDQTSDLNRFPKQHKNCRCCPLSLFIVRSFSLFQMINCQKCQHFHKSSQVGMSFRFIVNYSIDERKLS